MVLTSTGKKVSVKSLLHSVRLYSRLLCALQIMEVAAKAGLKSWPELAGLTVHECKVISLTSTHKKQEGLQSLLLSAHCVHCRSWRRPPTRG